MISLTLTGYQIDAGRRWRSVGGREPTATSTTGLKNGDFPTRNHFYQQHFGQQIFLPRRQKTDRNGVSQPPSHPFQRFPRLIGSECYPASFSASPLQNSKLTQQRTTDPDLHGFADYTHRDLGSDLISQEILTGNPQELVCSCEAAVAEICTPANEGLALPSRLTSRVYCCRRPC